MALVQSSGTTYGSATSASRTFASAPTAGRLLIAMLTNSAAGSSVVGPPGWTAISSLVTGNLRCDWWYKYAVGTEGTVSVSWTSGGFGSFWIGEFNDAVAGAPITAENEANASTPATSQATGSATATAASGLALAFIGADDGNNVDGTRVYSNNFAEVVFQYSAGSARSSAALASKVITAAGAYTTTFSCTDTGDEMYGAIALFQASATVVQRTLSLAGGSAMSLTAQARARSGLALTGGSAWQAVIRARARSLLAFVGGSSLTITTAATVAPPATHTLNRMLASRTLSLRLGSRTMTIRLPSRTLAANRRD